jgi:hypothetical protein
MTKSCNFPRKVEILACGTAQSEKTITKTTIGVRSSILV